MEAGIPSQTADVRGHLPIAFGSIARLRIVKALRKALADYTSQNGNGVGTDPTIDKNELIARVLELISIIKEFLLAHNFNLDDLVSSSEFERIALLKPAANELCVDLKTKKEFQTCASELFRLWKYLNKDEKSWQMTREHNAISGIYNELIEKTGCSLQTVSKTINSLKKTNFKR